MAIQETLNNVMYYDKMRKLEARQKLMFAIRTSKGALNQAPKTNKILISTIGKSIEGNILTEE